MKKMMIKYLSINVIIAFLITVTMYGIVSGKILDTNLKAFKLILTSRLDSLDEFENSDLINFRNSMNLEKLYYVEEGEIKKSADITVLGKKAELFIPKKSAKDFLKDGYWNVIKNDLIFYYPIKEKGIVVISKKIDYEKVNSDKMTFMIVIWIIISILVVEGLNFAYNIFYIYRPLDKLKKYIEGFVSPLEFEYYEKKENPVKKGDIKEFVKSFNLFLDRFKDKIVLIENDRTAMKQIYEKMKMKNSQLITLHNFSKDLSYEIDIEKIYIKIEEILTQLMNVELFVIMKQNNEMKLNPEFIYGVDEYRNIAKETLEKRVLDSGKVYRVKSNKKESGLDYSTMTLKDIEKLEKFLLIPLKGQEENIGVMIVDKIFNNKLTSNEEIIILGTIGDIIGKAMERALKYREMNIGLNITSILHKVTNLVQRSKNVKEALEEIVKSIKKAVDYTSASIYLLNDKKELSSQPEFRIGGEDELLEGVEFKLGNGIKALVAQKKDAVIIPDMSKTSETFKEIFKETKADILSFVSIPMLIEDELIGVINLTHKDANRFREEDKKILMLFSTQAASTIQKIRKDLQIESLLAKVTTESITDPLTSMYNRRYFFKRLEEEIEKKKRGGDSFGILAMDIDFFKRVNDTYGHQSGDEILKLVSASIKNSLRSIDIVARYGGEEFFAILPKSSYESLSIVAERIRADVEKRLLKFNNQEIRVTLSIGVALSNNVLEAEEIIKRADGALYVAKDTGRNRVVLDNMF